MALLERPIRDVALDREEHTVRQRTASARKAARTALVSTAITSVEVVGGTLTGVGVGFVGTGGAWLIGVGLGTVATGAGVGTWLRERAGRSR